MQDTKSIYKNKLCFYIPTANYHKEELRKQSMYNSIEKNEILRNKFNQGVV